MLIEIDRDASLALPDGGLVGRFLGEGKLYRVIDIYELVRAVETGLVQGGLFAMPGERDHGASWATADAKSVASWGQYWASLQRLNPPLFLLETDRLNLRFFRYVEGEPLSPSGPPYQTIEVPDDWCSTGLGCSATVPFADVSVSKVIARRGADNRVPTYADEIRPLSQNELERILKTKGIRDEPVRIPKGGRWRAVSGVIHGHSVQVWGGDVDDRWVVTDRNDQPVVFGAKSRKAAIAAAERALRPQSRVEIPVWLSPVPEQFKLATEGMVFEDRDGALIQITRQGSTYAQAETWRDGSLDTYADRTIPASRFKRFRQIGHRPRLGS